MSSRRLFDEHQRALTACLDTLPAQVDAAAVVLCAATRAGRTILVCGNGGSAADAQHFAAELVGRFERDRAAIAAVALTTDTSALTAIANDHGYDAVFSRQVEALARPGDVLVAISTSGTSPSVVRAADVAKERGCAVIGLTGQGGGALASRCAVLLEVPSRTVARVQELHILCLHALAAALEGGA